MIVDEMGNAIGEFAYKPMSDEVATFDIKIKREKQGQGYGQETLEKGIQRIATQHFKRIEIAVNSTNEPALKLYKKVDFEQIDFLKDNWVNQIGENCSTVVMTYEC